MAAGDQEESKTAASNGREEERKLQNIATWKTAADKAAEKKLENTAARYEESKTASNKEKRKQLQWHTRPGKTAAKQIKAATKRLQTAAIKTATEGQYCATKVGCGTTISKQQSRQSWLLLRCGSCRSNWPRVWVQMSFFTTKKQQINMFVLPEPSANSSSPRPNLSGGPPARDPLNRQGSHPTFETFYQNHSTHGSEVARLRGLILIPVAFEHAVQVPNGPRLVAHHFGSWIQAVGAVEGYQFRLQGLNARRRRLTLHSGNHIAENCGVAAQVLRSPGNHAITCCLLLSLLWLLHA